MRLEWREVAPGLLYEAPGDSDRLYFVSFDGKQWLIDLFQDSEHVREQLIDPQAAPDLEAAQRMAQEWEFGLC